jgi:hypothetical protein
MVVENEERSATAAKRKNCAARGGIGLGRGPWEVSEERLCPDFGIRGTADVPSAAARAVARFNRERPAFALNGKIPARFETAQGF